MGFRSDYAAIENRFRQQVDDHRRVYGLAPHQEIFVPMTFFPRMPLRGGQVKKVFVGMYPSQNWLTESDPAKRLQEANGKIDGGFRIALSTVWDLVFHLGIRQFCCQEGETYYVTDISKGAMKSGDEKSIREWHSWYGLLQDEMNLVLSGHQSGTALVIPIGGDVDRFLTDAGFGNWLRTNSFGLLTRRITHWAWAPRQNPPWSANSAFFDEYGDDLYELAAQLLDDVDAEPWWVQHVDANLDEAIENPRSDWQCAALFKRYESEFSAIK